MAQESDDGPPPLPPSLAGDEPDLDDFAIAAPNCPTDLVPMEVDGEGSALVWRCPECGLVRL